MKPTRKSVLALILLLFIIHASYAQGECALNVEEIVARVTEQCANIGENQVCYGNRNVVATPRLNTVDFVFQNPGDIVSLSNVQSLFVSEINPSSDEWGIAQMRLQISSERGSQNTNMLLFGRFNIQNTVQNTPRVGLSVRTREVVIYSSPNVTSLELERVPSAGILVGIGRNADSSWLQVENEQSRIVGWIGAADVQPVDRAASVGTLPIRDAESQYYGAMQAFTFTNGVSDIGCDNLASDGLLIQTPEGVARVSLLINEVSIELTGGGAGVAGTAFIQANPEAETGMQVNVVQGQANLETADGSSQTVASGQSSSIPLDENNQASGAPSEPIEIDLSNVNFEIFMPTFSNATASSSSSGVGNGSTIFNPDSSANNNNSSSGNNNNNNVTGTNLGGGNNNNNNSGSTTTGSGSIDINLGGGPVATSRPLPTSLDEIEAQRNAANADGLTQGNIIALTLASIAAIIVIGGIIFYTISNKKRN